MPLHQLVTIDSVAWTGTTGQASILVFCYVCNTEGKMSHEEQTDLRIRRTHHFLQEAMIELITEKGFEAITVGDIAERAMINRATFYRHYQDKYAKVPIYYVFGENDWQTPYVLAQEYFTRINAPYK